MTIHAKITTYKRLLVCEFVADKSIPNECTTSLDMPGSLGQLVHNTKEHLGISKEAFELLKPLRKGRDGLGEIDWFGTDDGHQTFGWLGGINAIIDPTTVETSRDWILGKYVEIPNEVAQGAIDAINTGEPDRV